MGDTFFWKRLVITSLVLAAANFLFGYVDSMASLVMFNWAAIIFFAVLTALLYLFSRNAMRSQSNPKFFMYAFGSMGIKFMACVVAVFIYYKGFTPDSIFFILPFFLMYAIFTVVEITSLIRIIQENSEANANKDPGNTV